mgnify:CR=1 FL=1
MSIETRVRETGPRGGGGGGGSSDSAGLAGTAPFYVLHTSGNSTLPSSRILTAGSSVLVRTDATNVYIDALTSSGAAGIGFIGGTGGFLQLPVQGAKLYANDSAALIDGGTPVWRLLYSATTQQYGVWQFELPFDYSGNPGTQLIFSSDSSLSVARSVQWLVDQWGFTNSQGNIYVDTFAGVNSTTVALSAGYSAGLVQILTVPLVNMTSLVAGNLIKLRVSSSAGAVTGNQELLGLGLFYRAGTQSITSGSGGLAGTGGFFVTYLADPTLSAEKTLTAGTNVTLTTDATSIFINSSTAGGAATSPTFIPFGPQEAKLYASNSAARIDAGTPTWRLLFSPTTQQYGVWQFLCPPDFGSNPYLRLVWSSNSSLSVANSVNWLVDQWGMADNQNRAASIYADTFGTPNSFSVALSAGYSSGTIMINTIPLLNTVSLGASVLISFRVSASAGALTGNQELTGLNFEYTRV